MREIKFRGFRKDGKGWVYGSFTIDCHGTCKILHALNVPLDNGFQYFEVISETVNQFTGLKDKNGKEIYEGDILEYDTQKKYVVVYSIEAFDSGINEHFIGAYMLRDDHNYHELICSVTRPYKYSEIIGNIHENKELIK